MLASSSTIFFSSSSSSSSLRRIARTVVTVAHRRPISSLQYGGLHCRLPSRVAVVVLAKNSDVRRRWLCSSSNRSNESSSSSNNNKESTTSSATRAGGKEDDDEEEDESSLLSDEEEGEEEDYAAAAASPVPSAAASSSNVDNNHFLHEIEVKMPDLGAGGKSRIVFWHKREGDVIRWQDALCDVETPDFTFTMACEDEGLQLLGKILIPAPSQPVPENQVICTLLHEVNDAKESHTAEAEGGNSGDGKADRTA